MLTSTATSTVAYAIRLYLTHENAEGRLLDYSDLLALNVAPQTKTLATTLCESSEYSPDGNDRFQCSDDPRLGGYRRIAVLPATGGRSPLLTETSTPAERHRWSADGKANLFSETRNRYSISAVDVATGGFTETTREPGALYVSKASAYYAGLHLQSARPCPLKCRRSLNSLRARSHQPRQCRFRVANRKRRCEWKSSDASR